MLLVQVTLNAVNYQVSYEALALESYWNPWIKNFTVQRQLQYEYGGFSRLQAGMITFSPDLFATPWQPPFNGAISAWYTATNEAAKTLIFSGTMHLRHFNDKSVSYEVDENAYTDVIAATTAYDTDLDGVFTTWCGAGILNLTLDTTYARATSPPVKFTQAEDILCIELASLVAAYNTHLFWIDEGNDKLWLIDMLGQSTTTDFDEFSFFPVDYDFLKPVAQVQGPTYTRTSAYAYGRSVSISTDYEDTEADINSAYDDIITILNRARIRFRIPFDQAPPDPGEKLTFTDTRTKGTTVGTVYARNLGYNFIGEKITIEGDGTAVSL